MGRRAEGIQQPDSRESATGTSEIHCHLAEFLHLRQALKAIRTLNGQVEDQQAGKIRMDMTHPIQ